jgi:hypothetical protein
MAANRQSSQVLVVLDETNATGATTIMVEDFAPQGCTIHAIVVQTQATAGGVGTIAITGGGNTLFNTTAPANQDQSARTTGVTTLQLTATDGHLSLAPADTIVMTRAAANSQNDIYFYYGDATPTAVSTS